MSAFKKLNRQDVYVSDYVAKKRWNASDTAVGGYNIETLRGFSGSTPGYPYPSDFLNNRYQMLVFYFVEIYIAWDLLLILLVHTGSLGTKFVCRLCMLPSC